MKLTAGLLIVMALLIGIVPQFTDCASQGRQLTLENGGQMPMKCHWTAIAEIGMAVPLLAAGVLMMVSTRKESLRNLSLLGGLQGILIILLPTWLIGVCANPNMVCNSTMKPALIMLGGLTVVLGVIGVARTLRRTQEMV